jgi:hypothetical protein
MDNLKNDMKEEYKAKKLEEFDEKCRTETTQGGWLIPYEGIIESYARSFLSQTIDELYGDKWISITAELPKFEEKVLVVIKHFKTEKQKAVIMYRVDEDDVDWRFDDGGSELDYSWNVFYWMPLPSTPA